MAAEGVEAANGAPPQVDDALRDLLPDDDDLLYEEELLRNPYALRMWIRYIEARKSANPRKRYLLYERALNALPGSYKVRAAAARCRRYSGLGLLLCCCYCSAAAATVAQGVTLKAATAAARRGGSQWACCRQQQAALGWRRCRHVPHLLRLPPCAAARLLHHPATPPTLLPRCPPRPLTLSLRAAVARLPVGAAAGGAGAGAHPPRGGVPEQHL